MRLSLIAGSLYENGLTSTGTQQCRQRQTNSTALSSAYFLALRKDSKPIKEMKNSVQ
jgi:hypothetical protein